MISLNYYKIISETSPHLSLTYMSVISLPHMSVSIHSEYVSILHSPHAFWKKYC